MASLLAISSRYAHPNRWAMLLVVGLAWGWETRAAIIPYEATGGTPAAITSTRDAFRTAVGGGSVAGAHGDFGGLRREISWDGVPDSLADPALLPGNFFNTNSPRGVVMSTPGAGFRVSANTGNSSGTPTLFGFPADLQTFSSQRLFAAVGSNVTEIEFYVPGTTTPATTNAFAAVFVDTEDNSSTIFTQMEFFDANNALLFSRHVGAAGNQGLSFLGGVADAGEQIARVRITTPLNFVTLAGGRDNEDIDFVVMDDFLYGTPTAVPEPSFCISGAIGLGGLLLRRRR